MFVNVTRFSTGVYPSFIDLLEKFNPQIGEDDPDLETEVNLFLDTVMATDPMRTAHSHLVSWGIFPFTLNPTLLFNFFITAYVTLGLNSSHKTR